MRREIAQFWLRVHFVLCVGATLVGFITFMMGCERDLFTREMQFTPLKLLTIVACLAIILSYDWAKERFKKNHPEPPDPEKLSDAICPSSKGTHDYLNSICRSCGHHCGHHNVQITYSDRAGGSSVSMCEDPWECPDCH